METEQGMYGKDPKLKAIGALAMGVPGEIAGLYAAWKTHGRLPWKLLFKPAIFLAKHGFKVSKYLAQNIEKDKELILADPGLKQIFAPNGKLLKSGNICYNVQLGHSLDSIALHGPQVFYNGELGEKFVDEVRKAGGILTMEDMKSYKVDVTYPVKISAMGYTVYGMPPPSTGTLGLSLVRLCFLNFYRICDVKKDFIPHFDQVLNIFKAYRSWNILRGLTGLHRLIEAMKHMFAIRTSLGDPKFEDISSTVSKMLSPIYAEKIQKKILDNTTYPSNYYNSR